MSMSSDYPRERGRAYVTGLSPDADRVWEEIREVLASVGSSARVAFADFGYEEARGQFAREGQVIEARIRFMGGTPMVSVYQTLEQLMSDVTNMSVGSTRMVSAANR